MPAYNNQKQCSEECRIFKTKPSEISGGFLWILELHRERLHSADELHLEKLNVMPCSLIP